MKQTIKRSCFRLKQWAVLLFSMLCFGAAWGATQMTFNTEAYEITVSPSGLISVIGESIKYRSKKTSDKVDVLSTITYEIDGSGQVSDPIQVTSAKGIYYYSDPDYYGTKHSGTFTYQIPDFVQGSTVTVKYKLNIYNPGTTNSKTVEIDDEDVSSLEYTFTVATAGVISTECSRWDMSKLKFFITGDYFGESITNIVVQYATSKSDDAEMSDSDFTAFVDAALNTSDCTYSAELPFEADDAIFFWRVIAYFSDENMGDAGKMVYASGDGTTVFSEDHIEFGAVDYIWVGKGDQNNWDNPANWAPNPSKSLNGYPSVVNPWMWYVLYDASVIITNSASIDLRNESYYLRRNNESLVLAEGIDVTIKDGELGASPFNDSGNTITYDLGSLNSSLTLKNVAFSFNFGEYSETYFNLALAEGFKLVLEGDNTYYWGYNPLNENTTLVLKDGTISCHYYQSWEDGSGNSSISVKESQTVEITNAVWVIRSRDASAGIAGVTKLRDGVDRQAQLMCCNEASGSTYYNLKLQGTYDIEIPAEGHSKASVIAKTLTSTDATIKLNVTEYKKAAKVPVIQLQTAVTTVPTLVAMADGVDVTKARNATLVWEGTTLYYQQDSLNAAMVGEVEYATLAEAYAAAEVGAIITLLNDVVLDTTFVVEKEVTLDMGGNTITADFTWSNDTPAAFWVKNGGNLTLKNGMLDTTVEGIRLGVKQATDAATKGTATIESDVVITTSDIGVMLYGGSTLNSSGTITCSSTDYAAIQGNGLDTLESTINITGGSVTSAGNHAIYHPQPGTLSITGGTISGKTGIEMRAGTLAMSGGTVTATGTYATPAANNSGSTVDGAAIVLSQHSTGKNVTATISGGAITAAENGKTFVVANTTAADPVSVTATIAAGVTDVSKAVVLIDTLKLDGNETDGYMVVEKVYVASVTDANDNVAKYEVFTEALAAAESGSTVKLLADTVYGEILTLAEGVTLDLNGKSFQTLAVFGDLAMNGGSLKTWDATTQTYYFMAAPAETAGALFWTSDAVLNVSSENYGLVLKSGAITMPNSWRSLVGQSLAISAGASFTIPENMTWNLRGNATVDNDATLVCNGAIALGESIDTIDTTATLTTTNDTLNVVSACEGYKVAYEESVYKLVKAAIDVTIGETEFATVDALLAAANSETTMTVTSTAAWTADGNVLLKDSVAYATFATYYDVTVDGTSVTLSLVDEVVPEIAESVVGAGDAFVMTDEAVAITINNAVQGLYYGIQQYSDAACTTKVGEAGLTAAGAAGAVGLRVTKPTDAAAFFRVVVTDIKPVVADGGTVEESTDEE